MSSPKTVLSANVTSHISFRDTTWLCIGNICIVTLTIIAGCAVIVTVYYMWKTFTRTRTPAWRTNKGPLSRCVDAEMGEIDLPDILEPSFQQPKPQALTSGNMEMERELKFHPDYCLDSGASWGDVVGDVAGVEVEVAPEYQLCEEEVGADVTMWGLEVIEEGEEE
ncbi:uncharacterized protein LOC124262118 isoform X2 [Haliotis rubra]|uniref:uncharacterized protein LOC124262118 isoform X2 n=1 Tax=Haliotis rubra TaxID=36100 RepID=UPI001EE50761|nr:uncharacterized protein LOC124262118 isoform X2 [Haliotis rubra]